MQFFFVPSASAETLVVIIKEIMLEVREVNFASHLRNLKDFIISIIIISGTSFCLYLIDHDPFIIVILVGFALLFVIPTIRVHSNYYYRDLGKKLRVNYEAKELEVIGVNTESIAINFKDIKSLVLTNGKFTKKSIVSNYFYIQIVLNNHQVIFLTSLLLKESDFTLFPKFHTRSVSSPIVEYFDYDKYLATKNEGS